MIAYTTVGTNNLDAAREFYDAVLEPIGAKRSWNSETMQGYSRSAKEPMFMVCTPHDKNAATLGNGTMIALSCPNRSSVEAAYNKALESGGQDEGAPGLRNGQFFIGYFRDLDGNKLALYTPSEE